MWLVTLSLGCFAASPPLQVERGVVMPPEPRAVPLLLVLGTERSERVLAKHEPTAVAGLGGHDVVAAYHPLAQLAGGTGFDAGLAPFGAKRATAGPDGGVVVVGGTAGASVVVESGINIVVGSEGPDHVKVWGGFNLILGRGGDDEIDVLGPGLNLVLTGGGNDSVCVAATGGLVLGSITAETKTVCPSALHVGDEVRAEVVGILSNHRGVIIQRGQFNMDDPRHMGSPEQEFSMEVLAVLLGPDPGPSKVYRPGGFARFDDGGGVTETSIGMDKWPRLDEPLHIMLRANTLYENPVNRWLFDYVPPGVPHVGTPITADTGLIEPISPH